MLLPAVRAINKIASMGGRSAPGSENFSLVQSECIPHKNGRNVRVIATITRILKKIFRSIAGKSSVRVGLQNVEAEVILPVRFIPITPTYFETLVYTAREGDIDVLAPYHGIGIGIRPRMKNRIRA